jgi:hypothetical protein
MKFFVESIEHLQSLNCFSKVIKILFISTAETDLSLMFIKENNVIEGEPPPKRPRIENETTKTEKLQATQEVMSFLSIFFFSILIILSIKGEATLSVETEEKKPIEEIPKTEEKKPIEEIPKTEEKNLSEIQEKTLISTTQPPEVPKETKTEVPAEESGHIILLISFTYFHLQ